MVTISPKVMLRCGIFEDYFGANFRGYDSGIAPEAKQALATVVDFCQNLPNAFKHGLGLFMYGSNGTGKTHLAVCALKYAIMQGYTGQLVSVEGAYNAYMDGKFGNEEAREFFQSRIKNVNVLILDDALKEFNPRSDSVASFFDNLIRHRMRRNLVTVITSNGTKEDFEDRYGISTVSLMLGKMIPIRMVWTDYRRDVMSKSIISKLHGGE